MSILMLLLLACTPAPSVADLPAGDTDADSDTPGDTDTDTDTSPTDTDTTDTAPTDTADTADTPNEPPPADRPAFGAIRWDAWQEDGEVNTTVESTLSPTHWHDRMPSFGVELSPDTVSIRGNDPAVMEQEIAWATAAGIDYWAFVAYPPAYGMSNGLALYLDSPSRDTLNFSLVLQGGWLASEADVGWSDQVARYVDHFADPGYQRVEGNRPLVFLFDASSMWATSRFPTQADAAAAFATLREASEAAGLGAPYLVLMGWDPTADATVARALGLDALSTYAVYGGDADGAPFADLRTTARATWAAEAATGLGVVPGLGAGWDPRPRIETPTPWATYADIHFDPPAADELAAHVSEGLAWVDEHPSAAASRAVVIYAWNEHDEGGWIAPTWTPDGPDTTRLDTVAAALSDYVSPLGLVNGSFEEPSVGYGWYVAPAEGVGASFVWESGAAPGSYLLADPVAAHFGAAASGSQALLLSSAGWISQAFFIDEPGALQLELSLLTGTYAGDVAGEVLVSVTLDSAEVATLALATPATPGVWEAHTLEVPVAAPGELRVTLTSVSGMPWVDAVSLRRE